MRRRTLLAATIVVGTAGAVALRGWTTKDRQIPPDPQDLVRPAQPPAQPAQPLDRRAGYRERKRACLDPRAGDGRRVARARSCRAWQEMLAQERERLARVAAGALEPR